MTASRWRVSVWYVDRPDAVRRRVIARQERAAAVSVAVREKRAMVLRLGVDESRVKWIVESLYGVIDHWHIVLHSDQAERDAGGTGPR